MSRVMRFKLLIDYLKNKGVIKTQKELGNKMGYSNESAFSQVINGKQNIPKDFMDKLKVLLPELNENWLLTGEGEMLDEAEKKESDNNCNESNCEEVTYVPLVPVASKGGDIDECTSSIRLADCEKILSPTPNAEIAITIRGDSMYPKYPNGTIAFIKEIDADLFIEWGRVYVLNTTNGSVTKVLTPSEKEGYIRCESINPDRKFAPFDVPMKSIKGIYKILLSLNPE